jgi:hypothetical protein
MHKHVFTVGNDLIKWENSLFEEQSIGVGIMIGMSNDPDGFFLQFRNFCYIGLGGYAQYNGTIH